MISRIEVTCRQSDEKTTMLPPLFRERVEARSTFTPTLDIYSVREKSKRSRCGCCSIMGISSFSTRGALSKSNRRGRKITTVPPMSDISRTTAFTHPLAQGMLIQDYSKRLLFFCTSTNLKSGFFVELQNPGRNFQPAPVQNFSERTS
jgi:hypothetical protein